MNLALIAAADGRFMNLRPAHPLAKIFLLAVAALVLAPLLSLIRIALQGDADIWGHLAAYVLPAAIVDTALLLAGVGFIACVLGVGTAWTVTAHEFPGRNAFIWLLPLPLAIPTYIVAYVYVDLFDALGPAQSFLYAVFGWPSPGSRFLEIRSLGGAILVMGFVLYPYVYLAARVMFQTQSLELLDMARALGAGPWRRVRDITLPMARPAIAAGLALVLMETLNDIGASEYLGVRTLTLAIFNTWLNRSSLPGAAQIAGVMLLAVAALIALERYGRRRQAFTGHDRQPGRGARIPLRGVSKWIAAGICFVPVLMGFLLPLLYLVHECIVRGLLIGFDPALWRHAANTVAIAAFATLLTLALGFGAAFAVRLIQRPFAAACLFVAGLGYALPGTVLALGLLSPLIAVDELINAMARAFLGSGVGLVLAGSSAALIVAYAVRFLAIATGFAQAGLARISTDLDDVARTAGANPAKVMRTVHLPLLRPAIWGAALLVFVDCIKELPATLLLRPLNVETLSTYLYQFASRGNFEEGALAALLIVLVGIVPVIRMVRHADDALIR
jgi:iron(III) transport system permease protein